MTKKSALRAWLVAFLVAAASTASAQNTSAVNTELPAAAALTDSDANPTVPGVGAYVMVRDSGTGLWKRLAVGQGTMAASIPVVLASNQTAIPVTQSGTWSQRLQDGSGNSISSTSNALHVNIQNSFVPTNINIAGTAVSSGLGASDAGTSRVAISSDSPGLSDQAAAASHLQDLLDALAADCVHGADACGSGPMSMFYASSTAPTAVGAAASVRGWATLNGAQIISQVIGTTFTPGDIGNATAGSPRVVIASNQPILTFGAGALSSTTYSASMCDIKSGTGTIADTTNHALCKAGAANVYGYWAINTTGTLAYLRTYDTGSDPTCSNATNFKRSFPIPASTSGAGFVLPFPVPIGYANGVGYCITGGGSSTDNTAPPAGVFAGIIVNP